MSDFNQLYQAFRESNGVFTDSRHPIDGGVFFALSGPNFNGNKFAKQALADGASMAVVDDPTVANGSDYWLTEDTLATLQKLANYHRKQFKGPVFALTGSNGKTTTKELISSVLKKKFNIISTRGNLNNHIGVPLTLLRIQEETEIAVIEMGANHVGEIKMLSEIADPSHGMITNIGKAHLEGFGGPEGVLRGKSELFDHLRNNAGIVFINSDDPVLKNMGKRFSEPIYFPTKDDYYSCDLMEVDPFVRLKAMNGEIIQTQLIGKYNFSNAAAALCIGRFFGVEDDQANAAIAAYRPTMNRSEIIKKGSNTIILDAYNANPDSMKVAVESLSNISSSSKVVILGDMLELGDDSKQEHILLGKQLRELNLTGAYFCGQHIKHTADQIEGSLYFDAKDDLADRLLSDQISNSTILIKASRSIGLETLLEKVF